MPSGGKRPGAGRPKGAASKPKSKGTSEEPQFDDPLEYLRAVACGTVPADALRIAAAKACLPFTSPKARAPVQSPAPKQLRRQNETGAEARAQAEWRAKAEAIRAKHREKNQND